MFKIDTTHWLNDLCWTKAFLAGDGKREIWYCRRQDCLTHSHGRFFKFTIDAVMSTCKEEEKMDEKK